MNEENILPKHVAIGSDHIGLPLKEDIKAYLNSLGIECTDCGTFTQERTDYPIYAKAVARMVSLKDAELGILICGTGVGMAIAANNVIGIRAVSCSEPYSAALSRQHNDTNVLTFGARVVGQGLVHMIIDAWLNASFEGGRFIPRLEQIRQMEAEIFQQEKQS
jgi:ribose 5-phosphate isomerase B